MLRGHGRSIIRLFAAARNAVRGQGVANERGRHFKGIGSQYRARVEQLTVPRLTIWHAVSATAAFLAAAALAVPFLRWIERTPIDWHSTAEAASTVGHYATALGVVIGGVWVYFVTTRRRSLEPRAELTHRHQIWADARGRILRLIVEIRNPSETMLSPGDGMTYVQTPPAEPINPAEYADDSWFTIAKIRHAVSYEKLRIDPKEAEVFVHDVRLPADARFIQLHTWVACEREGWSPLASVSSPVKSECAAETAIDDRPAKEIELGLQDDSWVVTTLIDLNAAA